MNIPTQSLTLVPPPKHFNRVTIEEAKALSREVGSLLLWRPQQIDEEFQYAEVLR